MKQKITIYVLFNSKRDIQIGDKWFPNCGGDNIYVKLQTGAALWDNSNGYLCAFRDNDGENISNKNVYYGDQTALYWIWKNNADSDIIGICHYRRYFISTWRKYFTFKLGISKFSPLSKEEILNIFNHYDAILANPGWLVIRTVHQQYASSHFISDLDLARDAIKKLYPEYLATYDKLINGRLFYWSNCFIAKKEILDSYAKWLFPILQEIEEQIDLPSHTGYQSRVIGYVAERLLGVWFIFNKVKFKTLPLMRVTRKGGQKD